jgi:hypothetical protein
LDKYYPILAVHVIDKQSIEQMGTKPKFWFTDTAKNRLWLFKYARPNTGEDWSEKIAAEVAELLGIPHAFVELATCDGRAGIVSPDFTERGSRGSLVHGNELLATMDPCYPKERRFGASEHTINSILGAIEHARLPADMTFPEGIDQPADLFVAYLMLDALIGNTDRHHENWGLLVRNAPEHSELAPTFDHASSLGRELQEEAKIRLLDSASVKNVRDYAAQARSAIYVSPKAIKAMYIIDAFSAIAKLRPSAYSVWRERLARLPNDSLHEIVHRVPEERMSSASKDFAFQLLLHNKERLLGMDVV